MRDRTPSFAPNGDIAQLVERTAEARGIAGVRFPLSPPYESVAQLGRAVHF